jgi:hypothetical protein
MWERSVFFWPFYLAPFIVGWPRKSPNLGQIFVTNLFLGWTGAGWVFAWMMVFPSSIQFLLKLFLGKQMKAASEGTAMPGGGMPQAAPAMAGDGPQQHTCPNGADGRMTCPKCLGVPSHYETGPDGNPQLVTCTYCMMSGNVQCSVCGGSGKVW